MKKGFSLLVIITIFISLLLLNTQVTNNLFSFISKDYPIPFLAEDRVESFLPLEYYLRIFLSGLLGLFIGIDRTKRSKPLGVKTYSLITIGTCLITIISIISVDYFAVEGVTMMDPMRLVAQVLPAIGFVGAGAIWFANNKVRGLTSAALVFFSSTVGVGIGAGFYGLTIFTFSLVFIFFQLGKYIHKSLDEDEDE